MEIILLIMCAALIVLALLILIKLSRPENTDNSELIKLIKSSRVESASADRQLREEVSASVQLSVKNLGEMLSSGQKASGDAVGEQLRVLENRFRTLEAANEQKLDAMRTSMTRSLAEIREENSRKLEAIQSSVNE